MKLSSACEPLLVWVSRRTVNISFIYVVLRLTFPRAAKDKSALIVAILRFLLLAALGVVSATLQTGCASTSHHAKVIPKTRPPVRSAEKRSEQYKIMPGDLLFITFAGEKDYDQQVRVDLNGRVSLPFLTQGSTESFQAAGLSVAALTERITTYATENEVLINPRVQVLVVEFATQSFVVLGQVALPGRYTFPRGLSPRLEIEEAVALAGGYTRLARQSLILVKRGQNVHKVDLRKLTTQPGQPHFTVVPGDVITVTERIF
jgi:protein involved in polysaccharide export with SLBB domain